MILELKPHQKKAVDQLSNGKILWGGVGSGKSITSLAYFWTQECGGRIGDLHSVQTPKDVYVITTARKRDDLDWQKEALHFGIVEDRENSISGIKLTVDSWNNIEKYLEVKDAFFIFDEQRVVGGGAWSKSFIKLAKANRWILLSATPGDTWLDYIPVFVANGFYKNRTEFKQAHVVYNTFTKFPKVDRYVGVGKLVRYRNHLLVHMPYEKHTVRHNIDVKVDYDQDLFDKVVKERWHVYEGRPLRDVAELFSVMRKVVNSDTSRLEAVSSLIQKHPRLIVFYNFDYELEILRDLLRPTETSKAIPSSSLDGLRGTIWEDGWDEEKAFIESRRMSSTSTQTSTKNSSSKSPTTSTRSSQTVSEQATALEGIENPMLLESSMKIDQTRLLSGSDSSVGLKELTHTEQSSKCSTFEVAEWNGHKHEKVPETERWVYLVQYQAGAEGWNCVRTDTVIFWSLTYSYKLFHQSHGRIDRLNTPFIDLYYYTLISDSLIDKAVRRSLLGKKSFNESSLKL